MNKAYELGVYYERKNTGCAQTTIAAIFGALGMWNEDVFRAGSGLADGLGLTGDGSCGALVGASMVIGFLFPRKKKDFPEITAPMRAYRLVKKLHDQYIDQYGVCRCHDIQHKIIGRTFDLWNPTELQEAMDSGMLDHCSKIVGTTARIATQIILTEKEK